MKIRIAFVLSTLTGGGAERVTLNIINNLDRTKFRIHLIERDWAVGKLKSLDLSSKKSLVTSKLQNLSLTRQCELLGLNRSSFYYRPTPISEYDLSMMRRIDEIYTDVSTYGYRKIHAQLRNEGWHVGHNKVHRLSK